MSSGRRVPHNTAEYARWLAGEISRRYRPTWFEPDTAMFLAMALEGNATWLDHQAASALNFTAMDDLGVSRVMLPPTMLKSHGLLTAPQSRSRRAGAAPSEGADHRSASL